MRRYNTTILILFLFIIDCVTGNFPEVMGYKNPDTNIKWWREFVIPFMAGNSIFAAMPYVLVLFFAFNSSLKKPIHFEWEFPDFMLALICVLSCLKTSWDWFHNGNTMKEKDDWYAFLIVIFSLIILKIVWTRLQRLIGKIRHL